MTTTPAAIIELALLDSGVIGQGQIASAEDITNGLTRLNYMVAQWNRKRWLIYNLVDTIIPSTGALFYTVGPGGDYDIPRPDRLEDGNFLRQNGSLSSDFALGVGGGFVLQALPGFGLQTSPSNPGSYANAVDYPASLIQSHEDYNRITMKGIGTFMNYVFYDSSYPLGKVYWWPVPQASTYFLNILTKNVIATFTSLAQPILLPDEYEAAILYNLQVRFRAAYRLPPDPVIIGLAKDALNVIRGANTQIPTRRMPFGVLNRRGYYNVYSDTT